MTNETKSPPAKVLTTTGTIPAVEGTTLTQAPHHQAAEFENTKPEPFSREMNYQDGMPGERVHDPAISVTDRMSASAKVIAKAPTPATKETAEA